MQSRPAPAPSFTFRDTAPSDAAVLVRFAREAFGAPWTEDFVRWKYFANPAGRAFGRCALLDGRPAAFYGNIPVHLKLGGRAVLAAQAVDAMVAPEARRRRLFVILGQQTFAQMDEAGVALAYAFPNPVSLAAFVERMGWKPVGAAPRWVRVLDASAVARGGGRAGPAAWLYALWLWAFSRSRPIPPTISSRRKGGDDLSIREIESFDERFDRFWQAAAADFPIAVVRDAAYLNWRYVERPASPYHALAAERGGALAGWAVLSTRDAAEARVAVVTELLAAPGENEAGPALLAECERLARSLGCAQLQAWLLPHHDRYRRMFAAAGFVFRPARYAPGPLRYTTPHIIRPHPAQALAPDPTQAANWFLSAGDYDYF